MGANAHDVGCSSDPVLKAQGPKKKKTGELDHVQNLNFCAANDATKKGKELTEWRERRDFYPEYIRNSQNSKKNQ